MVHYPSTSKRKGRPSLVRALNGKIIREEDIEI
jgi:hypothetical protein